MRFVLVGDGFPVVQIVEMLNDFDKATACMLFTTPQKDGKTKVEQVADEAGIPVYPSKTIIRNEGIELLKKEPFDWLININSTVIFPNEVLGAPEQGAINMHPGLLPEYAGLHTHQWAIRNGEEEFGATIHYIEEKLDIGDMISQVVIPIKDSDTGMSLFIKCIKAGTEGMRSVIQMILDNEHLPRIKQDLSKYHLYRHRDALDGEVDWQKSAKEIERFIRAGSYYPFESPTYKPFLILKESRYEILKTEVIQSKSDLECGQILWKAGNLIVGCGSEPYLKIVQLLDPASGEKLSQKYMKEIFIDGSRLGAE